MVHRGLGSISHLDPKTWKNTNPSIYYEMHLFFFFYVEIKVQVRVQDHTSKQLHVQSE